MNTTWINSGLTRTGVGCALVGVTVLLTVLFNVLGNLSCAVLSGMIFGAGGRWRWNTIPISLIFPAVILGLSHLSKLELPPGKVQLLALVCGMAFWGVYAMTFGLYFLEKRQTAPSGVIAEKVLNVQPEFRLAALSGSWRCEDSAANGSTQRKTLRIEEGKFVLTVESRVDRERVIARGEISVDAFRADHSVVPFKAPRDSEGNQ